MIGLGADVAPKVILVDYFRGSALPERLMPVMFPLFMPSPPNEPRKSLWSRLYTALWVLVNVLLLLPVIAAFVSKRSLHAKCDVFNAVASAVARKKPHARASHWRAMLWRHVRAAFGDDGPRLFAR